MRNTSRRPSAVSSATITSVNGRNLLTMKMLFCVFYVKPITYEKREYCKRWFDFSPRGIKDMYPFSSVLKCETQSTCCITGTLIRNRSAVISRHHENTKAQNHRQYPSVTQVCYGTLIYPAQSAIGTKPVRAITVLYHGFDFVAGQPVFISNDLPCPKRAKGNTIIF